MRRLVTLIAFATFAGCGGGSSIPPDMATRSDVKDAEDRLQRKITDSGLGIKDDLAMVKVKLPDIMAAQKSVELALADLRALQQSVDKSNKEMEAKVAAARGDMLKILEAEERLLTERLASIREVIQALKDAQKK